MLRFCRALLHWDPRPIPPPRISPRFHRLPTSVRIVESIRYAIHRWEYLLSPGGTLRQWAVLNARLMMFLGLPLFFVAPLITAVLVEIATWTQLILQIVVQLLLITVTVIALTTILCVVAAASRRK